MLNNLSKKNAHLVKKNMGFWSVWARMGAPGTNMGLRVRVGRMSQKSGLCVLGYTYVYPNKYV